MRNALIGFGLIGILAACSSPAADAVVADKDETSKEVLAEVVPNRMLTVDIDGMVCQMGCGGSIRKELKATNAVGECSFDYEEGRETNTATIEFDKELITADEISTLIAKINDGQFTVGKSSASRVEAKEKITDDLKSIRTSSEDQNPVSISSKSDYQLPNLLEIFSNLLTH
ncbi:MAG: hypothetical protein ACI865_000645 [Flavobacteriaceae bacterium]|jgi:hypothetical protein